MRGHVEHEIGLIAKGQADKDAVVAHTLQEFRQKFLFFVAKIARMDALFEASFSPLASSGMCLSCCQKNGRHDGGPKRRHKAMPACQNMLHQIMTLSSAVPSMPDLIEDLLNLADIIRYLTNTAIRLLPELPKLVMQRA